MKGLSFETLRHWLNRRSHVVRGRRARDAAQTLRSHRVLEQMPEITYVADGEGNFIYGNLAYFSFTGLERARWHPFDWTRAIHRDDLPDVLAQWKLAREAKTPFEALYRLRRANGKHHWCVARARPVLGRGQTVVRWVGNIVDVHAFKLDAGREHSLRVLLESRNEPPSDARLGEAMARACEALRTFYDVRGALLFKRLATGPEETVEVVARCGYADVEFDEPNVGAAAVSVVQGPAIQCLRSRQPMFLENRSQMKGEFPKVLDQVLRHRLHAIANVPVRARGEDFALHLGFASEVEFSESERAFWIAFARALTPVVESHAGETKPSAGLNG